MTELIEWLVISRDLDKQPDGTILTHVNRGILRKRSDGWWVPFGGRGDKLPLTSETVARAIARDTPNRWSLS